MTDDTKANINPVKDTQEVPMPSTDQQTTVTGEGATQVPDQESAASSTNLLERLPDDSSEHAKEQWQRLREQLRVEREKRIQYENTFANIQTQQPKTEEPKPTPIYDPNTGLLNEKAFEELQEQVIEAREQAKRANEEIKGFYRSQSEQLIQNEENEAYSNYPELVPDKSQNKEFNKEVRAKLLDSMMYPDEYGGKQLTMKQAADLVKKTVISSKEEVQKAMENTTVKEQASLEASGGTRKTDLTDDDLERLKYITRKGGRDSEEAIVQRLRRLKG